MGGKLVLKKICFVSGSSPAFLGGISLYQRNLIEYAKNTKLGLDFTWIYPGDKNKNYEFEGINCIEIKSSGYPILKEFDFARKARKAVSNRDFDIVNSHANWGYFLNGYKKKRGQKIIHTYHGATYPYFKIQLERFGFLKRSLLSLVLPFVYLLEHPPIMKSDKIICVSEKVKKQIRNLYGRRDGFSVIRTGVDMSAFKPLPTTKAKKELNLDDKKIYGLYSGRGGYWNKGLDRAVELSKEIYKINKNYRLVVVGADKNKCSKYLKEKFVVYRGVVERKELSKYYSACSFFFSLSRYEGGAPTLALSEAISSKCLVICSKDMEPEILKDGRDCLIIDSYDDERARDILEKLKNKSKVNFMKKSASEKIKDLSLEKWGKKYFEVLLG